MSKIDGLINSAEARRILRAAEVGMLVVEVRWRIVNDRPPDRRVREALMRRGLLARGWAGQPHATDSGLRHLELLEARYES